MELLAKEVRNCIDACFNCEKMCKETSTHCLHHGGKHAGPKHIGLMKDCANLCRASAELMLTNSEFSKEQCALCAKVCNACADECSGFDESFMKECAKICRDCAKSCEEMSKEK